MAGLSCPRCGGIHISEGKCEYCGFIIEGISADKAKEQQAVPKQGTVPVSGNKNLIECPDCGKMVSRDAEKCPHCGCPTPRNKKLNRNTGIIFFAIVAIIVGVIIWYKADPHSVPIWLQQIIVEIRKAFGATSWTIYGPWTKVQ